MVSSLSGSANTDEEAEDGMDAGIVRHREEGPDELLKLRPASHLYSHLSGVEVAQGTPCQIMG